MKGQNNVDTTKQLTHISLCAGYGGIDLGLHRVFGQGIRTIAFSEIEAFAVENLLAKMEAGLLPPAPIWTDLRTFPWADFQGVDILSGGFPCQPFSAAGKRNADSDPRHLFPAIVEGIRHAKPRIVFLENVEGIVSAKLAGEGWRDPAGTPVLLHVLRELERVGYRATAGIFSASEVGAPHQRKRVFIMAYAAGFGGRENNWFGNAGLANQADEVWPSRPGEPQYGWEPPRAVDSASSRQQAQRQKPNHEWRSRFVGKPSKLGDTEHARSRNEKSAQDCWEQNTDGRWNPHEGARASRTGESMGNALLAGSSSEWSIRGQQDGLGEPSAEAMGNTAEQGCEGGRGSNGSLGESRRFAKPSRSCANGPMESGQRQAQPPLGGDADGPADWLDDAELYTTCDNRTDELRLLGNGVVPATAERAFRTLMEDLFNNK